MNTAFLIAFALVNIGADGTFTDSDAERDARRLAAMSPETNVADYIELLREIEGYGAHAKPAIPKLAELLSDERFQKKSAFGGFFPNEGYIVEYVRDAARDALVESGIEAVEALTTTLSHRKSRTRRQAAFALGLIGPEAESSVPAIIIALDDPRTGVRCYAAWALGEIQARPDIAVPALISRLSDWNGDVVIEVAEALRKFGRAADSALPSLSRVVDRNIRRSTNCDSVVVALSSAGNVSRLGIPLILMFQERQRQVRAYCDLAAGEIDQNARQAIPKLLRAIEDGHGYPLSCKAPIYARTSYTDSTSGRACELLMGLGASAAPAVPKIVTWLKAWNNWSDELELSIEEQNALKSFTRLPTHRDPTPLLGAIGPAAKSAVPLLDKQLKREFLSARVSAARALATIDPPNRNAIAALITLLGKEKPDDPKFDDDPRADAARALLLFEKRALPAVPALTRLLQEPNSVHRLEAARVLGHLTPKSKNWRKPLVSCLRDYFNSEMELEHSIYDGHDYRESVDDAIRILGKDGLQFLPALIEEMPSFSWDEIHSCHRFKPHSKQSVVAMVKHGRTAIPFLIAAKSEKKHLRYYPVVVLGLMGPKAKNAIPELIKTLHNHAYWQTRVVAAKAIGRIHHDSADSVSALIRALKDERSDVRASAAKALGEFGVEATSAIEPLRDAQRDDYRAVRASAKRSITRIEAKLQDRQER